MKVKALRGVCKGVNDHLEAGKEYDLDEKTARWFAGMGAVEILHEPKTEPKAEHKEHESKQHEMTHHEHTKHTPDHPGKKEK